MTRYRITVRGTDVELRGYTDGAANLQILSQQMESLGIVVASQAEDDYDPFAISQPEHPPTPEGSVGIITSMWKNRESDEDFLSQMSMMHFAQANVIRGERYLREKAETELRDRELHHFEVEQMSEKYLDGLRKAEALNRDLVAQKEDLLRKYRKREGFITNLRDDIKGLRVQLASPPPGWYTLGTHAHAETPMEFWGDDAGLPLWERPKADVAD